MPGAVENDRDVTFLEKNLGEDEKNYLPTPPPPTNTDDDGSYVRVEILSGTTDDPCLSNLTVGMYSSMLGRLAQFSSMIQADSVSGS